MSTTNPSAITASETAAWDASSMHLGIAEQGKLYALEGQHDYALVYYREAIRLTVQAGQPEIVFRHYLECVLESLELIGAYQEVLDYCEKAVSLITGQTGEASDAELAHVYQRRGVVQLKAGERDSAIDSLRKATEHGGTRPDSVILAKSLLTWLERGLRVDVQRVLAEQQRTRYFSVRRESVDTRRAIRLPNERLMLNMKTANGKRRDDG